MNHDAKAWVDWTAVGVAFGAFFNLLPNLAALAALIWTVIRIYETDTVQRWLGKKKD